MSVEVVDMILAEVKKLNGKQDEMNDKMDSYMSATDQRMTWVETQIKLRVGNGQPGLCAQRLVMIEDIDKRVGNLERWRAWVYGIAAMVGALSGGIALYVTLMKP